jgi:hypothetical protein
MDVPKVDTEMSRSRRRPPYLIAAVAAPGVAVVLGIVRVSGSATFGQGDINWTGGVLLALVLAALTVAIYLGLLRVTGLRR